MLDYFFKIYGSGLSTNAMYWFYLIPFDTIPIILLMAILPLKCIATVTIKPIYCQLEVLTRFRI